MLIIMADLMAVSVGNMFMAAIIPGLVLAFFYLLFVAALCQVETRGRPQSAARTFVCAKK